MESSIANNPLAKHFRQPAVYLKLPSGGRFYPQGTLELGMTGEIPVYPMTVKDELLLKTPDALMNGASMVNMISSCCPSIKDPWSIPLVDLDPILIAIRLASYGQGMDVTSNCSHCSAENEHTVDLRTVLDSVPAAKHYDGPVDVNGLKFELKSQTFADLNSNSLIQFEQQKLMATITNSDLPEEEKLKQFEISFAKLTDLNINSLVSCIRSITTDDGVVVSDQSLIKDFLVNTGRDTYEAIRELIFKTVSLNAMDPITIECNECHENYKVNLEFNQSNFFA